MPPYWLRLAYISEFLLAVVAVLMLWTQVGGQGHLDLMPWYTKLGLTVGLAIVTVMGTVSAVGHERAWNAKTLACLLLALMLAGGMGAVTYYYHLHENDDAETTDQDGVATSHVPASVGPGL
jgi:Ni/Fe-hydrogenase subunit HybB-like protein